MNSNSSPFKWPHYAPDVILLCVRWYCRFQPSYRDIEEMMHERGLDVGGFLRSKIIFATQPLLSPAIHARR